MSPLVNLVLCSQADINFELERLRIELRHIRGMYAMAQGEAIDASRKVRFASITEFLWLLHVMFSFLLFCFS